LDRTQETHTYNEKTGLQLKKYAFFFLDFQLILLKRMRLKLIIYVLKITTIKADNGRLGKVKASTR